jgi:hypothetical protein
VIEKTSEVAVNESNSIYPPPPPPPPIAAPPPPPPATIKPLKEVNPAGVFQVHVPTVLNATTVWFPFVVISGVQSAACALLGIRRIEVTNKIEESIALILSDTG